LRHSPQAQTVSWIFLVEGLQLVDDNVTASGGRRIAASSVSSLRPTIRLQTGIERIRAVQPQMARTASGTHRSTTMAGRMADRRADLPQG